MKHPSDHKRSTINPFLDFLGARLIKCEADHAEILLQTDANMLNLSGRIHGGLICTLLDTASCFSGMFVQDGMPYLRCATLSITTNFTESSGGGDLIAKGFVIKKARSVFFAKAEVCDQEGTLLATSIGTFKYLR